MNRLRRAEAENYWWYRFVKTVYSLFLFSVGIIGVWVAYGSWPHIDYYNSRYSVLCDGGYTFGNFKGEDVNYSYLVKLEDQDFSFRTSVFDHTIAARYICSRETVGTDADIDALLEDIRNHGPIWKDTLLEPNNYSIFLSAEEYEPSFRHYWSGIGWGLVIFGLLLKAVPALFNYVVFGKQRLFAVLDE